MHTCSANINIGPGIAVDIGNGHAGFKSLFSANTGHFGDVAKFHGPFVQVQLTGARCGSKKQVLFAVLVHIDDADAASIVKIGVSDDVVVKILLEQVGETDVAFR